VGICRLCQRERELHASHLLAAGFYRLARTPADVNPNPIVATASVAIKSSREIKSPLLCLECEERFSRHGEEWILTNCLRGPSEFCLQAALIQQQPIYVDPHETFAVLAGNSTPGVNCDQLAYFAASVFWRAAAHTWAVDKEHRLKLSLGPYEDELRLFLLDRSEFPRDAVLLVGVAQTARLENFTALPTLVGRGHFRTYWFKVPGITFRLLVGRAIDVQHRHCCFVRSPERRIFVGNVIDNANIELALKLFGRTRVHANVRGSAR
jgi:hypothetical protein